MTPKAMLSSRRLLAVALSFIAAIACASSTETDSTGPIAVGTWGGDSAALIVGDTAIHLHIACTFGDISGRVTPDATGFFHARGSYVLRAYPITVGPSMPAEFTGQRHGNE